MVLARVAKARIRERDAWEFCERVDAGGRPVWTANVTHQSAVFLYPANCQRVDVVYDAGIGRYLLALGYDHAGGWGHFSVLPQFPCRF
ncbi:MAG: hypothetical protein ABSH56_05085 [Bryobacteraceae bacterium]